MTSVRPSPPCWTASESVLHCCIVHDIVEVPFAPSQDVTGAVPGGLAFTRQSPVETSIMGVGVRFFVVRHDDTFERWSQARFNRVWDGDEPVAEFAARRLRYALVFVDTQARRAVGIQAVQWGVLTMDASGRHDPASALSDAARVMGATSSPYPSPIVDARRKFYERRTRWKPTAKVRAAILDAALRTGR
jgi:hypothetical protein